MNASCSLFSLVDNAKEVNVEAESKNKNKFHTLSIRHSFAIIETCCKMLKTN
jgi:hypothetical protein